MNQLDDLLTALDERTGRGAAVSPDLGAVRTRARRKRRSHQALTATAAVTAVGLGAAALFSTRGPDRQVVTAGSARIGSSSTAPTTDPIDPLGISRALPGGRTADIEVTPAAAVYGPYAADHLWRPADDCPSIVTFTTRATDGPGDRTEPARWIAGQPTASGDRGPALYRVQFENTEGAVGTVNPPAHRVDLAVMTGTTTGQHYRLRSRGVVVDEVVAVGQAVMLADDVGVFADPRDPAIRATAESVVEQVDADGSVVATYDGAGASSLGTPDAETLPAGCAPSSDVLHLGNGEPPTDPAAAAESIEDALAAMTPPAGFSAGLVNDRYELQWMSATSAWVRYAVTTHESSDVQAPELWAEFTLTDGTWAPTAEATCAYANFFEQGTCDALPATVPFHP